MIIGRKEELKILREAYESDESRFIAVYGRRRVGKTFLVREAFDYNFTFTHSGIANASSKKQIKAFVSALKEQGFQTDDEPKDWLDAFSLLKEKIKQSNHTKKVIFLDELSWMASKRSADFISGLEFFWNGWASARKDVLLIVSSSASSWILDKVIHAKGGLYHRLNHTIHLFPFTLKECKQYCYNKNLIMNDSQILETYMIFGGVPYYWSLLSEGKSLPQNVDSLCFSEEGELRNEFGYLYATLFNFPTEYIKIVTAIAKKRKGLTRLEILEETKIKDTGNLTKKLKELIDCGFLREYLPFGKKKNGSIFQLIDNFTIFYFRIMKPMPTDRNYYQHSIQSGKVNAFRGLSFELVCLQHVPQIKKALGISGVVTEECSWTCLASEETGIKGHQIDLLIARNDGIINVCEMKYSQKPYSIDKEENESFIQEIADFLEVTKTKSSLVFYSS